MPMAASTESPPLNDRDLASVQEARALARRARQAQQLLAEFSQERVDAIVDAMAAAATAQAEPLARLAVEETGYGVVADKVQKNLFASQQVHAFIRPMRTVGVIRKLDDRRVVEIAEPFGVVAAVVPSTNPTSTAIYKVLIALKARCAVILSPHPSATRCIGRTAEVLVAAALEAGAPADSLQWMRTVTIEGTQELMKAREVAVILATGGMGLVRAAYSAGKPAYGVGPGNAPAYIERSADIGKAVLDVITGKTFDNGVLCSSENSVVVDEAVDGAVQEVFRQHGGYFLSPTEIEAVSRVLVTPQRLPNPALVGKSATAVAGAAGITVPPGTRVLLAALTGVGRDYPLSIEKLCPVLSYYVVRDWVEGCERCMQILRYGGMGHTMSIHSRDESVILEFGLRKPAFRICVNTPTAHGSIGLTTGLDPAMTLGCGGYGGNITSDNISPRHLLNVKRLAYEVRPARPGVQVSGGGSALLTAGGAPPPLLRPPAAAPPEGVRRETLARRIDAFLATRGYTPASDAPPPASPRIGGDGAKTAAPPTAQTPAADFICEEDVRAALAAGRTLLVGERTIVTPAARDLGEARRAFSYEGWRP